MNTLNNDDFQSGSLELLARAVRDRAVQVSDVIDYFLDRIAAFEPRLGAFDFLDEPACRLEAQRHDARLQGGGQPGKLEGIPIAVKDVYAVNGMPMRLGSNVTSPLSYAGDGALIKRLCEHAPVIIGKTTMTELSLGTVNLDRRQPWNPVDPNVHRTAGGSSGGSAVAVAAGLCKVALGTDTGGSVRQPASMCGVVGYKASYGIWNMSGIFPLSKTFDSVGVFTRTVPDLEYFLDAFEKNYNSQECPDTSELVFDLPQQMCEDLDESVAAQFDVFLGELVRRGFRTKVLDISDLLPLDGFFSKLVPCEFFEEISSEWYRENCPHLDPVSVDRLEAAVGTSDSELAGLRERLKFIRARASGLMRGGRFWICPTSPAPPVALAQITSVEEAAAWNRLTTRNTRPINVFNQCAISVPMRLPSFDLPIGVQVVASHGNDRRLLRAARALEEVIRSMGGEVVPDFGVYS